MVVTMTHYSRAQWAQMTKRAKLANFEFDPNWKCIIDGSKFTLCDHTADEVITVIEEIRRAR